MDEFFNINFFALYYFYKVDAFGMLGNIYDFGLTIYDFGLVNEPPEEVVDGDL